MTLYLEAAGRRLPIKKRVLKNTCAGVSVLVKLQGGDFQRY